MGDEGRWGDVQPGRSELAVLIVKQTAEARTRSMVLCPLDTEPWFDAGNTANAGNAAQRRCIAILSRCNPPR